MNPAADDDVSNVKADALPAAPPVGSKVDVDRERGVAVGCTTVEDSSSAAATESRGVAGRSMDKSEASPSTTGGAGEVICRSNGAGVGSTNGLEGESSGSTEGDAADPSDSTTTKSGEAMEGETEGVVASMDDAVAAVVTGSAAGLTVTGAGKARADK